MADKDLDKDLHVGEATRICERLAQIAAERETLEARLAELDASESPASDCDWHGGPVSSRSSVGEKIALFRSLFRGREDVFPKRWENSRTGKTGYAQACGNEWEPRLCGKPRVKCGTCPNQAFLPVTDEVIAGHLRGRHTIGVYPMLADSTCWFLAADFDKETWQQDVNTFLDVCRSRQVPGAIERSRSGNGGHVWAFFAEPVPASLARRLGAFLLTEAMECNPDIGFRSYDRFFPSQDTLPEGGFGNLIALPLQGRSREDGNSLSSTTTSSRLPTSGPFCRRCGACPWRRRRRLPTRPVGKAGSWAFACLSMTMTRNPGPRRPRGAVRRRRLPGPCRRGSTSFWAIRSTFRAPAYRQVWSTGSFVSQPSRTRRSTARRRCGAPPSASRG